MFSPALAIGNFVYFSFNGLCDSLGLEKIVVQDKIFATDHYFFTIMKNSIPVLFLLGIIL